VFRRSDGYSEMELLRFAHDHLGSAEILFKRSPSCYDSAGFLCHLAIELILKAHLLFHQDWFPNSHDLDNLLQLLENAVPGLEVHEDGRRILGRLDSLFTLRYPNPKGSPTIGPKEFTPTLALAWSFVSIFPSNIQSGFDRSLQKGGRVLVRYPAREGEPSG
jgi:HEPN domain-containing protein